MGLTVLLSIPSYSQSNICDGVVKIAVIDTGFGYLGLGRDVRLCKFGHKDFSGENHQQNYFGTVTPLPLDVHSHGTNIAGIIDDRLKNTGIPYCIVILKYWHEDEKRNMVASHDNLVSTVEAIKYSKNIKIDFINYSGGGLATHPIEVAAVKAFIDAGGTFVAAAGNERSDLSKKSYFPAMDDPRVVVVGNGTKENPEPSSNYGDRVNEWENGNNVTSNSLTMSGTSQATAIATAKLVISRHKTCDNKNQKESQ